MALAPRFLIGDLDVTDYPFMVPRGGTDGLDIGAAENMSTVIASLVRDGEQITSDRSSNREIRLPVYIEGADLLELASAEALLVAACEKPVNTLTVDPGDGFAPPSVFETFRIQLRQIRNDDEESAGLRAYELTIPARPWVRSANVTTITFAPGTPTFTTVDDGSSLALWSSTNPYGFGEFSPSTLSLVTWLGEAAVKVTGTPFAAGQTLLTRWTGTKPVSTYVAIDVAGASSVYLQPDYQTTVPVAMEVMASGYTRYYFRSASFTKVDIRLNMSGSAAVAYIGGIYTADVVPATGVLVGEIGGSVRTEGVVTVAGSTALGDTMVYSDPELVASGYNPEDSTSWQYAPEGTYAVWVNYPGAYSVGDAFTATVGTQSATTIVAATHAAMPWVPVGRLALGGRRDGKLGAFTITHSQQQPGGNTAGTPAVRLFRMAPDTSLTYVRGLTKKRLLIDLPSMDYPRGGVWAGDATDGSDAASVLDITDSWEFPALSPGLTGYYVRASGAAAPTVVVDAYERWHSNAAR